MEIVLPKEVKDGVAKIEIEIGMGKGQRENGKCERTEERALLKMLDGELKRPCALAPFRPSVGLSGCLSRPSFTWQFSLARLDIASFHSQSCWHRRFTAICLLVSVWLAASRRRRRLQRRLRRLGGQ